MNETTEDRVLGAKQIDHLTPEQEAQMPVMVAKYVAIGHCTDRIDPEKAKAYATRLYKLLGRDEPTVICTSGLREAWNTVVACALSQRDGITLKEAQAMELPKVPFVWPLLEGQFEAAYVAWVRYMVDILGVKVDADISIYEDQLQFGPIYVLDKYCVFSDRMSACSVNAQGQLHCDGGPAVAYADGTNLWRLNGVAVPQWLAELPKDQIDPLKFTELTNVEVRREFLRKMGADTVCKAVGATVLDSDTIQMVGYTVKGADGKTVMVPPARHYYELLAVDLGETAGTWPWLKMVNPSLGTTCIECVDQSIKTVREALAWRNQSDTTPVYLT